MPKPKSILENEPHKILWDIVKMDLALGRRPDMELINKTKCCLMNLAVPVACKVNIKEREEINNT